MEFEVDNVAIKQAQGAMKKDQRTRNIIIYNYSYQEQTFNGCWKTMFKKKKTFQNVENKNIFKICNKS